MRELHQKSGWRHGIVAARQFAILGFATWVLIRFENPLIWLPIAVVQGFTIFNVTILLHKVVHHTVFRKRRRGVERVRTPRHALAKLWGSGVRVASGESGSIPTGVSLRIPPNLIRLQPADLAQILHGRA